MAQTHFGFETVDEQEKAQRVRGVFDSVASKYDVMNDLMSMGMHRAWKAYTVMVANLKEGDRALDIAGGTGDLAMAFAKKVGASGQVVHTDINEAMLCTGVGIGTKGDCTGQPLTISAGHAAAIVKSRPKSISLGFAAYQTQTATRGLRRDSLARHRRGEEGRSAKGRILY